MPHSHAIEDRPTLSDRDRAIEKSLQFQTALHAILAISLEAASLEDRLQRILESIVSLSGLRLKARGGIYAIEDIPAELVMKTQVGMPQGVRTHGARLPFDTCLCGRAITMNEVVHARFLDHRQERLYPGIEPGRHYCLPIDHGSRRLGMLILYVRDSHEESPVDKNFLLAVADVLAGMIDRSRLEKALRRSEERFELAVRGTDLGIWDWDLRTNTLYFSPHWKEILGYDRDEIDQDFEEWLIRLHPDDKERALATIHEYLEGRRPQYELVHRLRHKDGSYRWVLARGVMVCDENGTPYRLVGSHLDITEHKAVEKRLSDRESSLIAARRLLEHVLPGDPYESHGLRIQGSCFAADYAPGDYFDYFDLPDGSVMVVIADVSGHGIESALLMSTVQARLRSYAELSLDITEILARTNLVLFDETQGDLFVTMMLMHIDPRSRSFTYANAGHPTGYLFSAGGELKHPLESLSMPLAFKPEGEFPISESIPIESGDLILLITDGVLEARSAAGTFFGVPRTLQVVGDNLNAPGPMILGRLHRAIHDFTGIEAPQDDETIVLVRVT